MAIIQLRETWDAYLQVENSDPFSFYHPDVEVLYIPTCMGAHGLEAYKQWYFKYLEPCIRDGLLKKRRVIKTHFAMDSVIEEAIVDIHFQYEQESNLSWIVPGVKFLNPNFSAKISVVFVSVHNFTQHPFQIRTKHVHWDQGSVLKQLNLLQVAVSTPPMYGFLPDFVLPLSKVDPESMYQREAVLNDFATRYEALSPLSHVAHSVMSGSGDSSDLLTDTPPPVHPPRTHVRVHYAAAATDKASKIFSPETLPVHAFSGIPVHPKKFEQHASVVGERVAATSPTHTSTPHYEAKSPGSPSRRTLFDPVTGEAPILKVHDPLNHGTQIVFATDASGRDVHALARPTSPSSKPLAQRKDLVSSFDMKYSETPLPSPPSPEKARLKPKPSHVASHFQTSLSTQSMEACAPSNNGGGGGGVGGGFVDGSGSSKDKETETSRSGLIHAHPQAGGAGGASALTISNEKRKHVPPHLMTSITSMGVGMDAPLRPSTATTMKVNMNEESSEEMELTRPRTAPPKHLMESVDPPLPSRPMRSDLQTTLDKPEKTVKKGYKKDLESHLFDPPPSLLPSSTSTSSSSSSSSSSKYMANALYSQSHVFPSSSSNLSDESTIPKKSKAHLESIVFTDAFDQVEIPKRQISEQHFKDDVVFGDDGGTTGLPIESPKYVISSGRRKPRHTPIGGRSTIQLG